MSPFFEAQRCRSSSLFTLAKQCPYTWALDSSLNFGYFVLLDIYSRDIGLSYEPNHPLKEDKF